MTKQICIATASLAVAMFLPAVPAAGQAPSEPAHDVTDLSKKTQNPVGDLITVPFQFNFNTGGDLEDRTFFNFNFQPVIPFKLTDDWSVIARTILPINSLPGVDGQRFSGMGDIQQQLFFTPAKPGGIIQLGRGRRAAVDGARLASGSRG